jgi:hypothetical protein
VCTIAWLARTGGYTLWHSRDEQRIRGVGIPPVVEHGNGVGWVSPRDSDSGGTWIGVNTHGVTVAIANLFVGGTPTPPARKTSRGLLVRELVNSPSMLQVERRLQSFDLSVFEPFTMVFTESDAAPVIRRWDRKELTSVEPLGVTLLVTSAGGNRSVEEQRSRLFAGRPGHGLSREDIEGLYRAPPESEMASVCVHRPDVMTVSLTRIEVFPREISLQYTPGQPCQTAAGPAILLDRIVPTLSPEASAPNLGNIVSPSGETGT